MIRQPAVSGRFYPSNPKELRQLMDQCEASPIGVQERQIPFEGQLLGLIIPHAGFIFSGPVATWAMRRLAGETPLPKRLLLLGPKHTPYGARASISAASAWRTPLGDVPVDQELRKALMDTGEFENENDAHAGEHSLEVQLPFLQKLYGDQAFSVLPVALQWSEFSDCHRWGKAISTVLVDARFHGMPIIISSDFSHDTPRDRAYLIDNQALDTIETLDAEAFFNLVRDEDRSICGVIPITTFLCSIKGRSGVRMRRLTYATSMDVMPHPAGVGYAAVAFEQIFSKP